MCALLGLWIPVPLPAAGETLVDRIVAVVDEDPIFLSDIRRVVGLGLVAGMPGDSERELHRRVLDGLIDHRLGCHEVERYDFGTLPAGEIDRQLEEIQSRFPDPATPPGGPGGKSPPPGGPGGKSPFDRHLAELGFSEEGLRQLLERQLRVLVYVEQRLGPRIFVDPEDIRSYYGGELARKAAAEGVELPPLEEIRGEIRALLREIRLNEEIEAWTEELRLAAEILDHLDRSERELPPVVRRFE